MGLTYEQAGVRGLGKDKSRKHFASLAATRDFINKKFIDTPFNTLYEVSPGLYHTKGCDGVGTKTLLCELAGKHDTIGIDLIASLANDCIRCGATPIAITNSIDSPNPTKDLVYDIQKGLLQGATQVQCAIVSGETASLSDMLTCQYVLNGDCVGEVAQEDIIWGNTFAGVDGKAAKV